MGNEFIVPNWHPILIHFPIALAITGVGIEILSFGWGRGRFRAAGRWMMLAGALLAIPAALAGIFAFRDVVTPGNMDIDQHWRHVVQQSNWVAGQWDAIGDHIWLNSIAVGAFLLSVIAYLGGSDNWRRWVRWPLLMVMLIGIGLMVVGAYDGGDLVYRYGTGVLAAQPGPYVAGGAPANPDVQYYIPPLELHVVLAGLVGSFLIVAFAMMLRRWTLDAAADKAAAERQEARSRGESARPGDQEEEEALDEEEDEPPARKVYPGWLWLGVFFFAIGAAWAGTWSVMGSFTRKAFDENIRMLGEADHLRLLLHVIFAGSLIVLALILAALVRFARRARGVAGVFGVIVILLLAGQIWLGTMMTYDSHEGPLFSFAAIAPGAGSQPHHPAAASEEAAGEGTENEHGVTGPSAGGAGSAPSGGTAGDAGQARHGEVLAAPEAADHPGAAGSLPAAEPAPNAAQAPATHPVEDKPASRMVQDAPSAPAGGSSDVVAGESRVGQDLGTSGEERPSTSKASSPEPGRHEELGQGDSTSAPVDVSGGD